MNRFLGSLLVLCGVVSAGCGSSGGLGTPVSEFPSRETLEELADEKADPKPLGRSVELAEWQMQPQGTELDATNQSLNEGLIKRVARADKAKVSTQLACAAREAARIYAQHEALPDFALQSYLVLRCGSSAVSVQMAVAYIEATASQSDAELQQGMQSVTSELIDDALKQPRTSIGVGYFRGDARAAVVAAYSSSSAELKDFAPVLTGNEVKVSGRVLEPADSIVGAITSGPYGVELCKPDRSAKLPQFRLTCPVQEGDQRATFSIMVGKKGRVLMSTVLRAMVRRSDEVGLDYKASSFGTVTHAKSDQEFQKALHQALNEARAQANLKPVKLEINQSKTNRRVVGQYFIEAAKGDDETTDMLALGVLAGWNVTGAIRGGGVLPTWVPSTTNPARFLGQILDDPTGRWILFEPETESIAIGARVMKPSGLVAMLTTYAFFGSLDHRADEDALFEQLSKVRTDNDLSAAIRLRSAELQHALAQVATGASSTEEALDAALEKVSSTQQRPVTGYVLETNDLSYVSFPEEFLKPGRFEVAVGVTHYKPPGAAWAQYAVIFAVLLPNDTSRNTARIIPLRRVPGRTAF